MNQWVENYLRAFVTECQNNWSKLLPMAEFTHNSWEHEQTKHTPHELIIGINPTTLITTLEDKVLQHRNASGNYRSPELMHRELYKGALSH
jgi:hypothetical protein